MKSPWRFAGLLVLGLGALSGWATRSGQSSSTRSDEQKGESARPASRLTVRTIAPRSLPASSETHAASTEELTSAEPGARHSSARRVSRTVPIQRQRKPASQPRTERPASGAGARSANRSSSLRSTSQARVPGAKNNPAQDKRTTARIRDRSFVLAGAREQSSEVRVVNVVGGDGEPLVRQIAQIWPQLRPNPLRVMSSGRLPEAPRRRGGNDDQAAAPISLALRPGKIYLLSDDTAGVETLETLFRRFSLTRHVQGHLIAAHRLQNVAVAPLAEQLNNIFQDRTLPEQKSDETPELGARSTSGPARTNRQNAAARNRAPNPRDPLSALFSLPRKSVRIHADLQTNTLIYQAPPRERAILKRVLERMDADAAPTAENTPEADDEQAVDLGPQLDHEDEVEFDPDAAEVADELPVNPETDSNQDDLSQETPARELPARRFGAAQAPPAEEPANPRSVRSSVVRKMVSKSPAASAQNVNEEETSFTPPQEQPSRTERATPGVVTGSLRGDVEIQSIPELGVFLINGLEEDVAEVERIIQQIEAISEGRIPVVEVVPLEHVSARALAIILNQIYSRILGARGLIAAGQEITAVLSLETPNSLLIVAPSEDMDFLREQTHRLDHPVAPETQFKVYKLNHAPASMLEEALEEFYGAAEGQQPAGLSPNVKIVAEARSNTLIVRASPRDLLEIDSWIEQIDVADTNAVNELRIFRLQNAVADDLAEILQQAILGILQPPARFGQQGAGQPIGALQPGTAQAQGAQGAGRELLQQTTSRVLRFAVPDGEGEQEFLSGILSDVRISADARSNSLIVSAPQKSVDLIAALIDQLDGLPSAVAQIKVFSLVNGDADTIANTLSEFFQRETGAEGVQAVLQPTAGGEGGVGSMLVPLRFAVDRRTNSIIASGNPSDLINVHAIIENLDRSDVIQSRKTKVFRLKHAPAPAVADAVNEFLQTEREVQTVEPEFLSPFEQIQREVVVVAEPVNNFLLISATPRYYEEIQKLILELDERPPMVAIQVMIAEVELGDHDEFGLEVGIQDSLLFDRSLISDIETVSSLVTGPSGVTQTVDSIISAALNPGYNFNNQPLGNSGSALAGRNSNRIGPQGLSHFSLGRMNSELGFGGLVLSAGSENLSVLLRALRQHRRVDILSRPQLVTLDNQEGQMLVGEQVPVVQGVSLAVTGQTNNIVMQDVGLRLIVTPRIGPDGVVTMNVDAEKSSVGPEEEGIPISISATGEVIRAPRLPTTAARTTISAASGQTVILGGMLSKENRSLQRRVPWLSDIPILGWAFRYDLNVEARTELLIILTPHVIRNDEDFERIKQVEARRMDWVLQDVEALQGDIGVYEEGEAEHEHVHEGSAEKDAPAQATSQMPAELPALIPAQDTDHSVQTTDREEATPTQSEAKRKGLRSWIKRRHESSSDESKTVQSAKSSKEKVALADRKPRAESRTAAREPRSPIRKVSGSKQSLRPKQEDADDDDQE